MTIRNLKDYMDKLWDWGFLNSCFGNTRIKPTDIDGMVEHNGHFLFLEAKSPGMDVPTGQRIAFDRMTRDPNYTVLVIWGHAPDSPISCQIWGQNSQVADRGVIQQIVSQWYRNTC